MQRTVRTLGLMMLPAPVLIYSLAHAKLLINGEPDWVINSVFIALWVVGIAALASSGWRREVIGLMAFIYTVAAVPVLMLLSLSAGCWAGRRCL